MIKELPREEYGKILKLAQSIKSDFSLELMSQKTSVLVYEENDEIVAFIEYLKLYETLEIFNIATKESHRRHGFAKRLLDYLIETSPEVTHILLEVGSQNEIGQKFYAAQGFKRLRTIKNYYQSGDDAYVMERKLENG